MKSFTYLILLLFSIAEIDAQQAGDYYIQSAVGGKYLNVRGAKSDNGTQIQIYHWANGKVNEKFTLEDAGGGYFYIKSHLGKYIHVQNRSSEPKALAHLWEGKGNDNTKWKFKDAGNGYYYIQSKKGTYLDVQWGKDADRTPVWMWTFNGGAAQKWRLKEESIDYVDQKITGDFKIGELCPNTADGHLKLGTRHFDDKVGFSVKGRIYFNSARTRLYVDIDLVMGAVSKNSRVKATWKKLPLYTAPFGYSINEFYFECGSRGFDGVFNHKRCRYPYFKGVKEFFISGTLPEGGAEVKPFSYHDGYPQTFDLTGDSYLLSTIRIVGDTGTEDVSDDRNCEHDAKIFHILPGDDRLKGQWHVNLKKITPKHNEKREVSVSIEGLDGNWHNDDCKRLQGDITVQLVNRKTGKPYRRLSSNNKMLSYSGNKAKDFVKRKMNNNNYKTIKFLVDTKDFQNADIEVVISSNIKGCHKSCDLCTDYNCRLVYNQANVVTPAGIALWRINNRGQKSSSFSIFAIDSNTGRRSSHKNHLKGRILLW